MVRQAVKVRRGRVRELAQAVGRLAKNVRLAEERAGGRTRAQLTAYYDGLPHYHVKSHEATDADVEKLESEGVYFGKAELNDVLGRSLSHEV